MIRVLAVLDAFAVGIRSTEPSGIPSWRILPVIIIQQPINTALQELVPHLFHLFVVLKPLPQALDAHGLYIALAAIIDYHSPVAICQGFWRFQKLSRHLVPLNKFLMELKDGRSKLGYCRLRRGFGGAAPRVARC